VLNGGPSPGDFSLSFFNWRGSWLVSGLLIGYPIFSQHFVSFFFRIVPLPFPFFFLAVRVLYDGSLLIFFALLSLQFPVISGWDRSLRLWVQGIRFCVFVDCAKNLCNLTLLFPHSATGAVGFFPLAQVSTPHTSGAIQLPVNFLVEVLAWVITRWYVPGEIVVHTAPPSTTRWRARRTFSLEDYSFFEWILHK